jgi:hypothetical protein
MPNTYCHAAVEIYLAHLAPKSENENYRKRVETAKDTSDRWENIFHKERKTTYLEDIEDDTRFAATLSKLAVTYRSANLNGSFILGVAPVVTGN